MLAAIAVDRSGNAFAAGYSDGIGGGDMVTIKYSSAGVPLWTNRYDGNRSAEGATAMAVDGASNIVVTGYSFGAGMDYATIKYSAAGLGLWTNRYNGPANSGDRPTSLAIDNNNDVFVTGYSIGSGTSNDYATIKYSTSGTLLWERRYDAGKNDDDRATAIAVDKDGNVVVTGYSIETGSSYDFLTIAYSKTGIPLWTNRYNAPENGADAAQAVAIDDLGNVFVTGYSVGIGNFYEYATVAYSKAGLSLWTNRYNNNLGHGHNEAFATAVDHSGNVFVAGYSINSAGSGYDMTTIAYANSGMPLWTNHFGAPATISLLGVQNSLAVDFVGNVLVAGTSLGAYLSSGYAVVKYSASSSDVDLPGSSLTISIVGDHVLLAWTNADFGLQSAPSIDSVFTNILGATSPFTNPVSQANQFFRLKHN